MKTLTVRLPDAMLREIEQESRARHVSKSDLVRERLSQPEPALRSGKGMMDVMGDILEAAWAANARSETLRFRSPKKQKLAELIRAKKLHR